MVMSRGWVCRIYRGEGEIVTGNEKRAEGESLNVLGWVSPIGQMEALGKERTVRSRAREGLESSSPLSLLIIS